MRSDEIRARALGLPFPGRVWLADWLVQQADSERWDWCDDVERELIVRVGPVASDWGDQSAADILGLAEPIRDAAVALPDPDRDLLVRELLVSVGPETDDARRSAAEWTDELNRRMDELDGGEVATIPWDEFQARLRATNHASSDEGGPPSLE